MLRLIVSIVQGLLDAMGGGLVVAMGCGAGRKISPARSQRSRSYATPLDITCCSSGTGYHTIRTRWCRKTLQLMVPHAVVAPDASIERQAYAPFQHQAHSSRCCSVLTAETVPDGHALVHTS